MKEVRNVQKSLCIIWMAIKLRKYDDTCNNVNLIKKYDKSKEGTDKIEKCG